MWREGGGSCGGRGGVEWGRGRCGMVHAWGRREGGRKNILKFDTRVHMQFKVVLSFEEVTEDCSYSNLKL